MLEAPTVKLQFLCSQMDPNFQWHLVRKSLVEHNKLCIGSIQFWLV